MGGGDRAGLLHQTDGDDLEVLERRRSSVGFEGYFDQYLGYGEVEGGKRRSRNLIRVDTVTATARNSGAGRWANSQESFVLGVNDPNSPASPTVNRLSPVLSDSGTVVNPGSSTVSRLSPVLSDAYSSVSHPPPRHTQDTDQNTPQTQPTTASFPTPPDPPHQFDATNPPYHPLPSAPYSSAQ